MKTSKKKYTRFTLFNQEKVILTTSKHWLNLIWPGLICLSATIFLAIRCLNLQQPFLVFWIRHMFNIQIGLSQTFLSWSGVALLAFWDLWAICKMLDTLCTRYHLTDQRIIITSGVIMLRMSEMLLTKCETVTITQNLLERIFRTGDILAISAGASLYLEDVPEAVKFRGILLELSNNVKN